MKTNRQIYVDRFVMTVNEFNEQQDKNWIEYCEECKKNNIEPQSRNNFNQFIKFDYKRGFVMPGQYPIYKKLKRNFY